MNKGKKFVLMCSVLGLAFAMAGCEMSEEQKQEASEYEEQAAENAEAYIKEKYGIDAEVSKTEYNKTGMFADAVSSYVDVEMKYKGDTFDVYIFGDSDWESGKDNQKKQTCDNFQYEEIREDYEKYIVDKTDIKIEELQINYNTADESYDLEHMAHECYEGDIEAFMQTTGMHVKIATFDENVGNFDDLMMDDGSLHVFSYDKDYYEEYGLEEDVITYEHQYSLWLNWSAKIRFGKLTVKEYEKEKFELGYVVFEKGNDVYISETEIEEEKWKTASSAYRIEADETVYLFAKADKEERLGLAQKSGSKVTYEDFGNPEKDYIMTVLDMESYDEVDVVLLDE